ncbi:hypothetical protein B0H13DRAFT_1877491 [Mycena leptocephala]|nr:hypothetical protein B0H13DRAFT_1877491 [Mycena leptocephala]
MCFLQDTHEPMVVNKQARIFVQGGIELGSKQEGLECNMREARHEGEMRTEMIEVKILSEEDIEVEGLKLKQCIQLCKVIVKAYKKGCDLRACNEDSVRSSTIIEEQIWDFRHAYESGDFEDPVFQLRWKFGLANGKTR